MGNVNCGPTYTRKDGNVERAEPRRTMSVIDKPLSRGSSRSSLSVSVNFAHSSTTFVTELTTMYRLSRVVSRQQDRWNGHQQPVRSPHSSRF